ncbi:co-chaperone GroES, partial [Wolbachia pipientis]
IVIPPSAEKKPTKGEVIGVGEGACNADGKSVPLTVKVGDTVFYRQWAGTEIEHNGEKFIVMKESDVLAVVKIC